ncbi:hypothetical protein BH10PSE17_BH10PSE17_02290 [soil metagenome]
MKVSKGFFAITLVALAPLMTPAYAQGDAAPSTQLVPCGSSLVLTKCPESPAVSPTRNTAAPLAAPARPAAPAAPGAPVVANPAGLNRVVVDSPTVTRDTTADTLQNDLGKKPSRRKPTAGAQRDDRDNFGQRTDCQQSKLPCKNQPGRPSTTEPGN